MPILPSKHDDLTAYLFTLRQIEFYIRAFPKEAEQNEELQDFYYMMHEEGLMDTDGHLQITLNTLSQVEGIHEDLLNTDAVYKAQFLQLQPSLILFKSKTPTPEMSDIEACLEICEQVFLLHLQKKSVSDSTTAIQKQIALLFQQISKAFLG